MLIHTFTPVCIGFSSIVTPRHFKITFLIIFDSHVINAIINMVDVDRCFKGKIHKVTLELQYIYGNFLHNTLAFKDN